MRLEIFDVGHGACALLTTDNGVRAMIDCGHRSTPFWAPGSMLQHRRVHTLDYLYVTNYDEDHVSGLGNLLDSVAVSWIFRNGTVSPETITRLKSDAGMGPGIARLVRSLSVTHTVSSVGQVLPVLDGVTVSTFCNPYPMFDDENNLSLIVHLDCRGVGIMFTGDMEVAGFAPLHEDPIFRDRLRRTAVFVAPHHGRLSGCCPTVASICNPFFVVVSDKEMVYETQRTHAHYHAMAQGGTFRGKPRRMLTTRNDGAITIDVVGPHNWFIG